MTKIKNTPGENITNMPTKEIKEIKEIKLKYLLEKENEHGTNHFFDVLDITPLQDLIELRKSVKIPIWEYNNKFHFETNVVKHKEAKVENGFQKTIHTLWTYYLINTIKKNGEQITGYSIPENNKIN